jgi:hypothetical protein
MLIQPHHESPSLLLASYGITLEMLVPESEQDSSEVPEVARREKVDS